MKTEKTLVEGLETLGMMASQIRRNGGIVTPIEADIILAELRDLYVATLAATRSAGDAAPSSSTQPEGAAEPQIGRAHV